MEESSSIPGVVWLSFVITRQMDPWEPVVVSLQSAEIFAYAFLDLLSRVV